MKGIANQKTLDFENESFYEVYENEKLASSLQHLDFLGSKNTCSKPNAQTKSKHAFPFGAQISTPCTYSVF